jgi:hypothetical protein
LVVFLIVGKCHEKEMVVLAMAAAQTHELGDRALG